MSKNNEEGEGFFKKFVNKFRSKEDKKPDKRSIEDCESNNISDLQISTPNPPTRRRRRKNAPSPPIESTTKQSSTMDEKNDVETGMSHIKIDEINTMFSKLSIEANSEPQIAGLTQNHVKSVSENSQLKKKIRRSKSSIKKKRSDATPKTHHNLREVLIDINDDENLNIIKNCQVQESLEEGNDIGNTISQNVVYKEISADILKSETATEEIGQVEIKSQKSLCDESTIEIKNEDSEKNNKIAENLKLNKNEVLEDESCKLENQKFNPQKEDETNKSLNKEIENKSESNMALEQINRVMEEVKNIESDIQNLDDLEEVFIIESGLTNAMIKLDSIQTSKKNELVRQKRKDGIITIQELFKLLDKQKLPMEGPIVKSKQFTIPVKVKRKTQQNTANNKNFLTTALEQIALILKDIKEANQQIKNFKGVFQNNPDYIQIADILFSNLSILGKLSTRKLPELERIKEDGMLEIENSIRNLDLKLQRNYENSFGKFQKRHSEVLKIKKLSKASPTEVHCHKSDTAIGTRSDNKHVKEVDKEEKYFSAKERKIFKNETNKCKDLEQLSWSQYRIEDKRENSNTEDYFSTDQKIKNCLVLNPTVEDQNTEISNQNKTGNFKKYVESVLMEDFGDVKRNLSEEMRTLKEIERTVENQSRRYAEPIQAASDKIYNDLKYFKKFNNKIERTISKIEEFSRNHKSVEKENQAKPELIKFMLDAQSDRMKIMEKVSVLLMQLQVLFLILIIEIPLLVLFVLALVWRR